MFLGQIEERWEWIYELQTEVRQANTLWLWGNKNASRPHQPFVSAGSSESFASVPPLMLAWRRRTRIPPGLFKPFCLHWLQSAEAAEPLAVPKTSIVNQPRVINAFRHGRSAQPCLQGRKENWMWLRERVRRKQWQEISRNGQFCIYARASGGFRNRCWWQPRRLQTN